MSEIAIKVENLSKYYKLGVINSGTLSRDLQSRLYKMMGKEDPNKRIGSIETDAEGFWALKDLSFEIKKGDRVGIIGKNGAGKSTLLKMLSQISSPTTGKIYIDGKIASLLEVGTGFNPELTGRENIYLNGAILGMKKKEVDRKIDEIISFSEIERHIDTPVKRYSSGMYVRLAFAVAAHLESDILIADEVLAVGDASFQKKAINKMNELSTGAGRTILFVSHQMQAVKNLCNKGVILEYGTLLRQSDEIESCINYYLGKADDEVETTSWQSYENQKNNYLTIKSLYIEDERGEKISSKLQYEDNYFVVVELNVTEITTNLLFGIRIDKGVERVSGMGLSDINILKLGYNKIKFRIPAGSLLPGRYELKVSSSILYTSWVINPDTDGVQISVTVADSEKPVFSLQ